MTLPTMRIIAPAAIGDAQLISSNVVEVPPAAWNSGTTYALNAQASLFSGVSSTTADVYQSRAGSNLNHNPASSPTWWTWVGTTYAVFVPGGPGGAGYGGSARVIDSTAHLVYESLINANVSADLADGASWAVVGATNKWAMFDQSNTTQSSTGLPIAVTIAPAGRIDSVALFNLAAASVTIVSVADGVTIYNETIDLTDTAGIDNYYDWFFAPIERVSETVVTDIPPYLNQTITITVANGSGTASIGTLIVGQKRELGMTLAGAEAGILDYSKKETNEWGDTVLTERAFAKKLSCTVVIDNDGVDRVQRLLTNYRATPLVWQATDRFETDNDGSVGAAATQLFGFYRSFSVAFSYPTQSVCSLELEGLT